MLNTAYDNLKVSNADIVDAYENLLSARLQELDEAQENISSTNVEEHGGTIASASLLGGNWIEQSSAGRHQQMNRLVQAGLKRTQKDADTKWQMYTRMQAIDNIKGIMEKAVQTSPAAAVAWVGVSFILEILSNPMNETLLNRQGISYVSSRMEWYWNLVFLMLDENRPSKSAVGLKEQLKKRLIKLYQELLLYQMKSVLVYHRDRAPATLRDLVKFDDWQGQLQDVKKAQEIMKKDLNQFSTEKFKSYLRNVIESANSQERQLLKINSAIQDQTKQQAKKHQNDKDEECKRYIFETDPSDDRRRIQETKGGLLRDSYRWILNHDDFRRFQEEAQSRVLWIKGDSGKGKTMLLCGIIDELEKMDQGANLTYFLCQATVP
ncbi:hypothetical protein ACO1O0_007114 [Amphichorda felina]